ncbi:oxidoreductase [Rhodococcus sp. SC4]|jgi:3-oxoacyl-[acyl-carrier protein] reductase|nr:oxidoreductase [Rhodococcus sp. SC4]
MVQLSGRVALVTGGARGIGAGVVEKLVSEGASVVFTYVGAHAAATALTERLSRPGGEVAAVQADSANEEAIVRAIDETVQRFGRLDILVNNAGGGTFGNLDEMALSEIDTMIDVNIRGLVLATRHCIPHLDAGGRIVNIGSISAERAPFPGASIYGMTKGAVASFTRGLSRELGPRGITVNNVQPGPIATEANPADGPDADYLRSLISVGRFGRVEDVASLVAFLAGSGGEHITGASITIDGGFAA